MNYLIFNKPYQVMSTFTDPDGRRTLADYVTVKGVYAAGRLDYHSEGLLLLTDDGELNHRLTDPRFDHVKTYLAQVEGTVSAEALARLGEGVVLRGERTKPVTAVLLNDPPPVSPRKVRDYHPTNWLQLDLREGKKHQVRRMTAAVGLPCLRLVRIGIGPLALGSLEPGRWRPLSHAEQAELLAGAGMRED